MHHLKGTLDFRGGMCKLMVSHNKGKHGFGIIAIDRTWYFCAPTEDDRTIWVNALLDLGMSVDNPDEIGEPDYKEPPILPSQPGLNRNRPLDKNNPIFEEYESSEEKVFERVLSLPDQPGVPPKPIPVEKEEVPLEVAFEDERKEEISGSEGPGSELPDENIIVPLSEDINLPVDLPQVEEEDKEEQKVPDIGVKQSQPKEEQNVPGANQALPREEQNVPGANKALPREEQKVSDVNLVLNTLPAAPLIMQDKPARSETPLPVGWERKVNAKTGAYFYIDHNTNTYHKTRPREDIIVSNFV